MAQEPFRPNPLIYPVGAASLWLFVWAVWEMMAWLVG